MAEVTIRHFEDSDLPEVLKVLRAGLGESLLQARSEAWFRWKHFENPFGRSILLVADVGGRIAGVRAFLRWELATPDGGLVRCVRPVDTATHPDFQRIGVFRALTEAALDEARADGVDLVFNTPNPRSGAGYRSMGWAEIGSIGVMVRPSPRLVLAPFRHDYSNDVGGFVDGGIPDDSFVSLTEETTGLRTPRHAEYLRWRFAANPVGRYVRIDAEGATVMLRPNLRKGLREVVVSDVWGRDVRAGIQAAVRASEGDYLVGWFPKGSAERKAAVRAGMLPVPRVTALTLYAKPLRELAVNIADIDAWRFTMSDLELL
ncbi:MAG: GNAT family N-acetyltransferase [Acidimicrobiia bacterium]